MILAVAARTSVRQGTRAFRTSAVARSAGHGEYHHLPFALPTTKAQKTAFALKLTAFAAVGIAIPVLSSIYQMKKTAGAA
ncbi:hypothetical protein CC1G_00229 [Coprinopsis cinerea okayama7|uniref:Cytochrome c oxidase subunit 8, mitochondrial n=1 Tax=Coprinopsis cinerea (strain Okayama-7 / 130 / ATCC MYA-4618 / FGSC 9003) TaxID=240176 RepID=A8NX81_COPC7|nr:hypothetical protein CC1G_00229 [Coprinopsis cinerea okayama7\|eukprot:XP_001837093.1 hypothetical protein CC1G_00229 [Coprinopsis cinerea okayama7\